MKNFIVLSVLIVIATSVFLLFNQNKSTNNTNNEGLLPQGINTSTNSDEKCIITILGEKYDVTQLRTFHPGGNIYVCDSDMTDTFLGQHGNDLERISKYKVLDE